MTSMLKRIACWWRGPTVDAVSSAEEIRLYDSEGRGLSLPRGSYLNWTRGRIACGEHEADFPGALDHIPPKALDRFYEEFPGCTWI